MTMALLWASTLMLALGHDCSSVVHFCTAATTTADAFGDSPESVGSHTKTHRCETHPRAKITLMTYLACGKALGLLQWFLVPTLTPEIATTLLFHVYPGRPIPLRSLVPYVCDRQVIAVTFVIFYAFYSILGPVWAVRSSCSGAGYIIIVSCMLSGFLTVVLCVYLGASEYETSLVFVPWSWASEPASDCTANTNLAHIPFSGNTFQSLRILIQKN